MWTNANGWDILATIVTAEDSKTLPQFPVGQTGEDGPLLVTAMGPGGYIPRSLNLGIAPPL